MKMFKPEGFLIDTAENQSAMRTPYALDEAMRAGRILEARVVLCDSAHNLRVNLGCMYGIIPRELGAVGISDGSVRDIALISRVNKSVCFYIEGFERDASGNTYAVLNRLRVQLDCMDGYIGALRPGDVIDGRVTHLDGFGAFVDIGAGISALLPIDAISVSRIPHPSERFSVGESIKAVVRQIDDNGRISLTHKELLGAWEENAARFKAGETVAGIIRSVESYGVFVELTPNLAGLAEPADGVSAGQSASVYIKSLIPERMKVKLIIIDAFSGEYVRPAKKYYFSGGHMDRFVYSPPSCSKVIESRFDWQA